MPLIRRTIDNSNPRTTHGKSTREAVFYVEPRKVRPGDRVIEPLAKDEKAAGKPFLISDAKLADLAIRFPEEYGAAAEKRGIKPGSLVTGNAEVVRLMTQPAKELVKSIGELSPDDAKEEEILWGIYEAETGDEGAQRASILSALERKGITDRATAE